MAFLPGWSQQLPITINNTGSTANLSYYQLGISITGSQYLNWIAYGKSDGSDIRVTDNDQTTLINHWVEDINTGNSGVQLLVKVPFVAAGSSKNIYVYWGNPTASSTSDPVKTIGPSTSIVGPTDVANQSNSSGYNMVPTMILLKNQGNSMNGHILAVFSSAGSHVANNKKTMLLRSVDSGVSYNLTTLINPGTGMCADPIGFGEMSNGSILLFYTYDTNAARTAATQNQYIAKSTDGGQTWVNLSGTSNPVSVPWSGGGTGLGYGNIIEDNNGNYLLPAYGIWGGDTKYRQVLLQCASGNDPTNGNNWATSFTVARDGVGGYCEGNFVAIQSGTKWLAVLRDQSATGDLYSCVSTNNAASGWSAPVRMGMPNSSIGPTNVSPHLLRLSSGNILLSYAIRSGSTRWGSVCRISKDEGVSFMDGGAASPLVYTAVNSSINYGYPGAVQRSDGKIVIVGYHDGGGTELTNIASCIVDEDWILNSVNVYKQCESLGEFISTGIQASLSSTRKHSGTNSIKIDNNTLTGADQNAINAALWPTGDSGDCATKLAFSTWVDTRIQSTTGLNTSASIRDYGNVNTRCNWAANYASGVLGYYNGSFYTFSKQSAVSGEWTKITNIINAQSSISGRILKNNVDIGLSQGQGAAGNNIDRVRFSTGSVGSNNNCIAYFDDIYSHQYTPVLPSLTFQLISSYTDRPIFLNKGFNSRYFITEYTNS